MFASAWKEHVQFQYLLKISRRITYHEELLREEVGHLQVRIHATVQGFACQEAGESPVGPQ